MGPDERGGARLGWLGTILFGAAAAPVWLSAAMAGPDASQARAIEQENTRLIAGIVGTDDDTPANRKLAERPDIQAAFDAYRRVGGLAPKFRFAHAFATTSGFAGGPLAGMIGEAMPETDAAALKAHPAAFDLVCAPRSTGEGKPATSLRFSVDVPAGLWRSGPAYIQPMQIGERGKLVTKWHIDLEHVTWGAPVYDRIARVYDEVVTTSNLASRKPTRTSVHATCELVPYSKLFGAGR